MINKRVEQIRTDALVAKSLYTKRLRVANAFKVAINVLIIITPILFIAAQYLTKGSAFAGFTDTAAFIGSVLLLCLAIYTLIINLDSKIQKYVIGIKNNVYVASEALKLINEASDEKLNWFYTYVAEMDTVDADILSGSTDKERQKAYRAALMQLNPGDNSVVCPICNASPFRYKKGSCQVCGNTPIERKV